MSTMSTTSGSTSATSITVKDQHSYWPLPHDEEERFKTVLAFKVLDTEEDPVLQSLCVLARTLTGTCFAGKPLALQGPMPNLLQSDVCMPHPYQCVTMLEHYNVFPHQACGL